MPSRNPKHRKKRRPPRKMGVKKRADKCVVGGCSKNATNHVAMTNVSNYAKELNWVVDPKKKTRRAGLCKKHYKAYKKVKKKDEKYKRMRDFGPRDAQQKSNFPY